MEHEILNGSGPAYLQLYEKLRDMITSGVFPCQAKFPSKRVLADRYGVSLITVEHCLSLLCEEGYLEARERSGCFVIFREGDLFSPVPRQAPAMPAEENGSSAFPFSTYAKTVRKVLNDYGEHILERVPGAGLPKLKEAIASYLARSRGIRVKPEQLIIGAGSEYLYMLLVQFFGKDAVFAIEKPSYAKIELVYRANGCRPELLPLGDDGIASDALNHSRAGVLHITPYRSFPSGISTSASKRREYIRWAEQRGGYIIEDDYESEFSPSSKPAETVFSLAKHDNVLYLNSFSRTISPSTRISYLIVPETLLQKFRERLDFYACTVPGLDQYVLAEFIDSGEFERHLNRTRRKLRAARNQLPNG